MVEINIQRKAFLDMLAWSEGTDNGRQKTRNHGYDVIVGVSYLLITPITSPSLHAKPKLNQQAPDASASFRWWDAYRKQLPAWTSLRKSGQRQQIKDVALYHQLIIMLISVRRCYSNIELLLVLVMISSDAELTAWCKIQAGGTVRSCYEGRVTAIISALVICIIVCVMGC